MRNAMIMTGLITLAALFTGCGDSNPVGYVMDSDNEPVTTQSRQVGEFDSIAARGMGQLVIEQTGTESLTITASEAVLPMLECRVVDGQLHLGPRQEVTLPRGTRIVYHLTVKDLRALQTAGAIDIEATGIDTDEISITLAGAGRVSLAGTVERQLVSIAGAGSYDGESLDSSTAQISIAGAGSAVVCVRDHLDVRLAGAGMVEYIGDPELELNVGRTGTVRRR